MKHHTVCTQCAAGPVPVAHGVGSVGREPESSRLQAALTVLPEGDMVVCVTPASLKGQQCGPAAFCQGCCVFSYC